MNSESLLQTINNILLVNCQLIRVPGLMTGTMGVCIYLYEYANHSDTQSFNDFADIFLLNHCLTAFSKCDTVDFADGLPGMLQGVLYSLSNQLVEGNPYDILLKTNSQIEQIVYQLPQEEVELVQFPSIIAPIYFIFRERFGFGTFDPSLMQASVDYVGRLLLSDISCSPTCMQSICFFLRQVEDKVTIPDAILRKLPDNWREQPTEMVCDDVSQLGCLAWQGLLYGYSIRLDFPLSKVEEYVLTLAQDLDADDLGLNGIAGIGLGLLKNKFHETV